MAAEGKAKQARLRVWEKYVEGQEAEESAAAQNQSSWKENTARKVGHPSPPTPFCMYMNEGRRCNDCFIHLRRECRWW